MSASLQKRRTQLEMSRTVTSVTHSTSLRMNAIVPLKYEVRLRPIGTSCCSDQNSLVVVHNTTDMLIEEWSRREIHVIMLGHRGTIYGAPLHQWYSLALPLKRRIPWMFVAHKGDCDDENDGQRSSHCKDTVHRHDHADSRSWSSRYVVYTSWLLLFCGLLNSFYGSELPHQHEHHRDGVVCVCCVCVCVCICACLCACGYIICAQEVCV